MLEGLARRNQGLACPRAIPEHLSLHEIDVEVAVVVEIEHPDTGRHYFREIELARHAVEMEEVDTGLLGLLDKPLSRSGTAGSRRGAWRRIRAVAPATEARHAHENHECWPCGAAA